MYKKLKFLFDEVFRDCRKSYIRLFMAAIVCMFTIQTATSIETNLDPSQAQRRISGMVVGIDNEPVIGANVQQKDLMTNGTVTDINGSFTLNVPNNSTLVISFIGYITQEVATGTQTTLRIILREDLQSLEEVVVIGYGSVAKKELTSAVSHVSSKDFLNVPSSNPVMQIQGRVAGVSISNTGTADPNSDATIQVRGVASRSASNSPLIVIDGVPGGNLQNVNENDIESISVLKDGAASAIYGTRGSNGVIMVTTKRGSSDGSFRASYTGYISMDVAKKQLKVLSAEEFRKHPERGDDFGANTNWFDELTQTGVMKKHTLQVSGGTMKNNYRASVDYYDGRGIDIRSDRKEIGARIAINHTSPNDLYRFTFNVSPRKVDYSNADRAMFWQALTLNPTMPVWDPKIQGQYYMATGWEAENPVEKLNLELNGGMRKWLDWDGTFRLNLLPLLMPQLSNHSLNTQITIAQQLNDDERYWFRPSTSTLALKTGRKGEAEQDKRRNIQESLEWLINYNFESNGHNLKFMGGYSYQYFQYTRLFAQNSDFPSDGLTYNSLQSGTYMSSATGRLGMSSNKNDHKLIAFFGRVSYDYKGKYLATASLRYEGSSRFGTNSKWGYFPAVSVGWRLSDEGFLKTVDWINELKLRADYGVTGNRPDDSYLSLATYASGGTSALVNIDNRWITAWGPNRNVNPDLKWELGKNWNIGLDFTLFRIFSGSFNYFNRTQQDLLGNYNVSVPPNITTSKFANVGTMNNQGVELELNIDVINRRDLSYNVMLVGSTTNNKFLRFSNDIYTGQKFYWMNTFPAPGSPGAVQRIQEGERVGTFFTYKYAGVDEIGNWMIYNKDNVPIPINQGKEVDMRPVGNGLPKFSASLNNTLRYKNIDATIFLRGNFGYQVYNVHEFYWGLQSAASNLNVMEIAYTKNAHLVKAMNAHNSYFVQNADWFKLDIATIGYTFKAKSKWIEGFRFYVTGRNLLMITAYKGVDPDQFLVNGMEPGNLSADSGPAKKSYYPSTRQFLVGLQVNF